MAQIIVNIVDDHALFRRGVSDIIRESEKFWLQKEYSCGLDFLNEFENSEYNTNNLDLLLLDVQMPKISGLEVLKRIRVSNSRLKIVILTASAEDEIILDAIRYGANGFLPKDTLPDDIILNLQSVMQGTTILHPQGVAVLADQFRVQYQDTPKKMTDKSVDLEQQQKLLAEMTQREQETLFLIAKGLNNKLIARALGISDGTVKVYVKNLLRKLKMHSRLELSIWVHQNLNITDISIHDVGEEQHAL